MGMTRSEKILARASGKARVAPGDMVVGQADVMMGNDITAALTIRILEEHGITKFADPDKVFIVMSHFVPAKDIASAAMARACRDFARKYEIQHYFEAGQGGIEHALLRVIKNLRTGHSFQAKPFPPEILEIIQAGGLMQLVKKKMAAA